MFPKNVETMFFAIRDVRTLIIHERSITLHLSHASIINHYFLILECCHQEILTYGQ